MTVDDFLNQLLTEGRDVTTDEGRWALIRRAWEGYREKGASHFDWDYDSRTLMDALVFDDWPVRWEDQ